MRFSIIIPVFNAEKYLETCLLSVLDQDYSDCEILLINDGSKDGSEDICKAFAQHYCNVRWESQKNAGPSAARNRGIRKATGEYLIFLDADDEMEAGSLNRLEEMIWESSPDAIVSGLKIHDLERGTDTLEDPALNGEKIRSGREAALEELAEKRFYTPASRVVVKRKIVTENGILFPEECAIGEDVYMMAQVLCQCESFVYNPQPYYVYNQTPNSIMHSVNFERIRGTLDACGKLYNLSDAMTWDRRRFLLTQISRMIIIVFTEYASAFNLEQKNYTKAWMKEHKPLLREIAAIHPTTGLAQKFLGAGNAFLLAGWIVAKRRSQ